jgi:hypothetical protein
MRQITFLGLAAVLMLGTSRSSPGQGFTADPFNVVGAYNLGYLDYLTPTYPNGYGVIPNQGALSGRSGALRANQFQSYLDEIEGLDRFSTEHDVLSSRSGSRTGVPYYRATRRFESTPPRITPPNPYESADRAYLRDRQARDEKYFEYLRETDPRKRAQLYREYTQENLRAARELAQPRSSPPRSGSGATVPTRPSPTGRSTTPMGPVVSSPASSTATGPRPTGPSPGAYAGNSTVYRRIPASPPADRRTVAPMPPLTAPSQAPGIGNIPPPASNARRLTPSEILDQNERRERANRSVPSTPPDR